MTWVNVTLRLSTNIYKISVCPPCKQFSFFANNVVLLDNQASQSIFKDIELVTSIEDMEVPFEMRGVQEGAEEITVTKQGRSEYFGIVPFSTQASANILSQSRMKDAGANVEYSDHADCYMLRPAGSDLWYCFRRRMDPEDGTMSRHYIWDPSDNVIPETRIDIGEGKGAPQDALTVETVRDTKRRVTKRQLDQMKRVSAGTAQ